MAKYWNFSASATGLPMNIQDWSPLGWTGFISLQSKGLSRVPTPQFKNINSSMFSLLYDPILTSIHYYWKSHSLDYIGAPRWRRDRLPAPVFLGLPPAGKESACNAGDLSSIPELGKFLEKGKATHSSIVAWRIPWTIQSMGLQSQTRLSDFHFHIDYIDLCRQGNVSAF